MRYLILSERDREKFGCPDKLPWDWGQLSNKEAVLIQRLGFKSLKDVLRLLAQHADDGVTEETVLAVDAVVWLALRRCGIHVDIQDLEYDLGMEWFDDDPPPEPIVSPDGPGKDPDPAPSANSRKTRSTSSRTSRRKSTPTG